MSATEYNSNLVGAFLINKCLHSLSECCGGKMKIEIKSYSHAVGEFNYHIQLTPAFRRPIFENERVMKLTLAYVS